MITQAETTRALATTCAGEAPPEGPLPTAGQGLCCEQPPVCPELCHAGGRGLGAAWHGTTMSSPSTGLEEHLSQLVWLWGWPVLQGRWGLWVEWPLALWSANSKNSIKVALKNSRKGFWGFFGACFWLFCCWDFFKPPSSLWHTAFSTRKQVGIWGQHGYGRGRWHDFYQKIGLGHLGFLIFFLFNTYFKCLSISKKHLFKLLG